MTTARPKTLPTRNSKRAIRGTKPRRERNASAASGRRRLARVLRMLRVHMPDLKARYHIKSLEVFGSFSRQDATPQSDLDLLVEFDEHDHLSLLGYIHLENELGDLVGVKVDLVEKKMLPSPILERVMNEAVRI